uniref:A-kinase anchor protein 7-like phosphoesterase domain-containing protein n=1 Tax=Lotharella oceanica TaxID=641309 RepID=A0A7S2U534_9EUKA|mmetsp:Transcript_9218/g.17903  ORF Transcript_9218/g.17903 Transcript_9218/m.17903 type:complete len:246 (+) Transcript_9218:165-902(+)|eukprot:CAMPEP_0170188580 /NCGR_PEP_ID=MMETSP0040_2-20121228/44705_1 /TAXON_ID=641309 /ORGANISM="Lotharella oceanica, Strain CCMP622" /LENGTH=245 /DNA_ID=CAMNT_0010435905 /DNA_START=154 /DNA_END=891 /DNA_ORIENTATION=+
MTDVKGESKKGVVEGIFVGKSVDLAKADLDNPERRGQYFVEWRVTDESIAKGITNLQGSIRAIDSGAQMLQSCAVDNMHITMNQLVLSDVKQVQKAIEVIRKFEEEDFRKLVPSNASVKMEVGSNLSHFKQRVLFAPVSNDQTAFKGDILVECFNRLQKRLVAAGFKPSARPLKPHLTVAKAAGKRFSDEMFPEIMKLGGGEESLGTQWLRELVFCVKRTKREKTPPVLYRCCMGPPPSSSSSSS